MNAESCLPPLMMMDWYLNGWEAARMYLDTRDRERPVKPLSVHALTNILSHTSVGIFAIELGGLLGS